MNWALSIYHGLPSGLRNVVASGKGLQLRRWRYGSETEALAQEAVARERWSPPQWREWQNHRLAALLERACTRVPYYRKANGTRALPSAGTPGELLRAWPVLQKEELRRNPKAFLADDTSLRCLRGEHTSGTTGTPLTVWHSRVTSRQWYALMEARWRGWNGVSRQDPWAILGGQLVVPISQRHPPFWVWNAGLHQLYLSSFHLSADNCASYFEVLRDKNVRYLWGYPSSLYSLALFAAELGLQPPQLKVVISNAEALYEHQRGLISEVFGCPVKDTYGMAEMACGASECEHGRLHLWPEAGLIEVLADDADKPVPYGAPGRLVCTGLMNVDMPLIRYEVGDRGILASPEETCPCGRTLPILRSVEGRIDDVILAPDGRRIGRLDPVFKSGFAIRQAQIIQETASDLRVLVVPGPEYTERDASGIAAALRKHVNGFAIRVEAVSVIPKGAQAKEALVVSRMTSTRTAKPRSQIARQSSLLLRCYHSLPAPLRTLAASSHGYLLRARRYSPRTESLISNAIERDNWSPAQWQKWQQHRLQEVLHRSVKDVPYYRGFWRARTRNDGGEPWLELENWPILTKETLRQRARQFLADGCDPQRMLSDHTSGTTGTPLDIWFRRQTVQQWYALCQARHRRWHGLTGHERWAHMGGQPVVPFEQSRPPYWVWNAGLRQLYLSCMHVSPESSVHYLHALNRYQVAYLLGYSSSIAMLAQAALKHGIRVPLKVVLTDSEPLLAWHREVIGKAFQCPVRETYGMAEIVCAASECPAGCLHLWPEVGHVEILGSDDRPVNRGEVGRIVATGLLNADMPFVRYDTLDLARFEANDEPCPCGRSLPRIGKLLGRNDDVIVARDGRRLVQLDRIFDSSYDLHEAQIVQEAIGQFRIRVVPGERWTSESSDRLCEALRHLVGEAAVQVEHVDRIERTWAGKYRVIVSHLTDGSSPSSTTLS